MYSVTVHFSNGLPMTEVTDEVEFTADSMKLRRRNGDFTIVPFAHVLYVDVTEDDDDSEFGDDAAVYLAPRG